MGWRSLSRVPRESRPWLFARFAQFMAKKIEQQKKSSNLAGARPLSILDIEIPVALEATYRAMEAVRRTSGCQQERLL